MAKREVKEWITVNGVHVPIFEGESKAEAVKRSVEGRSGSSAEKKSKSSQITKDEKTKQEQIKKNEAERKQRNLEQVQKLRDNRFAEDVEKARNGDLSARNDYMDRLNAINAKIGSGRGSAKLVEEVSQLREKINKINNAYRESDKYKKDVEDRKHFEKEQADKRAARVIADIETLKAKEEAIKESYEKQMANKGTTYEVMEKDGKYVVVGGNNNGRMDPGSWHSKREDYLDRGYKPLPDEDYKKYSPGRKENNDVTKMGSGKAVDEARGKKEVKESKYLYNGKPIEKGHFDKYKEGVRYEKLSKEVTVNGEKYRVWSDTEFRGTFAEDKDGDVFVLTKGGYLSNEKNIKNVIHNVQRSVEQRQYIGTGVPKSFAANYPGLTSTQIKQKYAEYLKKNGK